MTLQDNPDEHGRFVAVYAEDHISQYLRDITNYPIIDGEVAFYDTETYYKHMERGIDRSPEHLLENWNVSVDWDGEDFDVDITNTKMVGRWNLLEDILSKGTSTYVVPFGYGKKMTFWSRYKNHWYFNMTARGGIGMGFVRAMTTLIEDAAHWGVGEAMYDAEEVMENE